MKTLKFLIFFTSIFSLVIVSSCKKDDDVDPNNDFTAYDIKTVTIPDAMAQSNDEGAQTARTFGYGKLNVRLWGDDDTSLKKYACHQF